MKRIITVIVLALMVIWGVGVDQADATYWTPTLSGSIDVNYTAATTGSFAIFDGSDATLTGSHLDLNASDTIYFHQQGSGNWFLTKNPVDNGTSLLTLTGSNQFQLGYQCSAAMAWVIDSGYTFLAEGLYKVEWSNLACNPESASIVQIDAIPSNVPIPGAVWLLGSGLLGLVGIRRKKA